MSWLKSKSEQGHRQFIAKIKQDFPIGKKIVYLDTEWTVTENWYLDVLTNGFSIERINPLGQHERVSFPFLSAVYTLLTPANNINNPQDNTAP